MGKVQNLQLIFTFKIYFSHPWETVAQAAWRKYPNPMNTAVVGTDVIERTVIDGVLHTHRLVRSQWYFPKWVSAVSLIISNYKGVKFPILNQRNKFYLTLTN